MNTLCEKCGEPMSEHPCPKDVVKILEGKFTPIMKEIEARELLLSIVADVEAMKCEMPSWHDVLEDSAKDHWFGPFEEASYDSHDYSGFYIQWPNLDILIEQAKEINEHS